MGVLASRQGGRYTVTDLSPSRLVAPVQHRCWPSPTMTCTSSSRRAPWSISNWCGSAASAPTPEQRQRIHKLAVDGRAFDTTPSPSACSISSTTRRINDGAGNALLTALAQVLYDLGLDVRRTASEVPGVIDKSNGQHIEIANADPRRRCADRRRRLSRPSRACARHHHQAIAARSRRDRPMAERIAFRMNLFPGQAAEYESGTTRSSRARPGAEGCRRFRTTPSGSIRNRTTCSGS